ncbi:Uncharacterised protein (fragment) (plasmid) [Cupriavidus neocaledonicus]|uniref:Uncharacterized protein n=1 Tax=Cupriavidus neocaledonicus TaxID=1040979 RepID=A0A375HN09_9BURK
MFRRDGPPGAGPSRLSLGSDTNGSIRRRPRSAGPGGRARPRALQGGGRGTAVRGKPGRQGAFWRCRACAAGRFPIMQRMFR